MIYILVFSNTWTIYDPDSKKGVPLSSDKVALLQELFSKFMADNKILLALQVSPINPNRLLQLPASGSTTSKKGSSPEPVKQ